MANAKTIPNDLRVARRSLEAIPNVKILQDWMWYEKISSWVLYCELTISDYVENPFINQSTNWYIATNSNYPLSNVSFFPSKVNGIEHTFQHQHNNSKFDSDLPWRWGLICLDLNVKALGRYFVESEPFSVEDRLAWYVQRAINWLKAAVDSEFTKTSEVFELPDFSVDKNYTLAFSENASSFKFWMNSSDNVGTVNLVRIVDTNVLAPTLFINKLGKPILSPNWGNIINKEENKSYKGIWIKLSNVPVFEPWQPPSTFGELITLLNMQGIDFHEVIKSVTSNIRDNAKHFLLLGFPIPRKYGEQPIRIHWQPILLPILSSGSKTMKGFRPNERGKFLLDKLKIIKNITPIDWLHSENWDKEQISARGRFQNSLSSQKVLIIGCGAIGSMVAELLVRGNVNDIVLIDGEELEAGNLVRHTLDLEDIKKSKARQLAQRLSLINPNSKVNFITKEFPPILDNEINMLNACNVIIDCTGDDKAAYSLNQFLWNEDKLMISISLNYGATKSFVFARKDKNFPIEEYSQKIGQHLVNLDEIDELVRDGIGCWHPVFPARADDVWLLVSACVKEINNLFEQPISSNVSRFAVFEQIFQSGEFIGIRKTG